MDETDLKREIEKREWKYNTLTRWLVLTNTTPYALVKMCGVDKSVVSRWVHSESLPAFVHWAFLAFDKMRLCSCSNVKDCF